MVEGDWSSDVCSSDLLAFHGPKQRINIEDRVSKKDVLQAAAKRISESLFS